MMSRKLETMVRTLVAASLAVLVQSGGVNADDTEIYRTTYTGTAGGRPQVLIVFDDSGSMSTVVEGQRPDYDPNNTSYTYDGTNKHPSNRIYWSVDGQKPAVDSDNYFLTSANRCASALAPLATEGFTQTRAQRWSTVGGTGWKDLSANVHNPPHLDCQADVLNSNPQNPGSVIVGYPQDTSTAGQEYGPNPDGSLNWGNTAYTFYSAHYMDYWYDSSLRVDRTRLEIARSVVSSLVSANTSIDFGLVLFNENDDNTHNGGRVVQRLIPDMSDGAGGDRENLTTILNGTLAAGFTPLCETTMEAYRYLAGDGVVYGYERNAATDVQPKDDLAESPAGTYRSPLAECAASYIILMTDGRPTNDLDANADIERLTGKTCQNYLTDHGNNPERKNCLPELAEYMANNDLDGDSSNGEQHAFTYTIGFGLPDGDELLTDTATNGGGQYKAAADADELAAAFNEFIGDVLASDTTFTSPAVAVDTFTRTESRNEVFFAMFKPDSRIDWPGNIKRLDIDLSTGAAVLVDKNGDDAIDPAGGQIKATATTVWSTEVDGPSVLKGGVGALLAARDPATRTIYSNTGNNEALQRFGPANMTASALGLPNDAALYDFFGVSNQGGFNAVLDWAAGYDISDEDEDGATNDPRPWILADMLHSKPLVVNYGERTASYSPANPDLRIIVGTNAGFLHMFNNADGQEDWAFFAKELGPVLEQRRINAVSSQHVYGIDAPAVVYTDDVNRDGSIKVSDSDKAYLYFGLRRGGRMLYAMDISNPNAPKMLWRIGPTSTGFAELGQTWSVPVVTRIPGYQDNNGVPKPVLVFGAGYDTNKDSGGLVTPDAMGRGIFIVDAATGALVWSLTPAADSATNMQETGLVHSVAASVTVLDSNGDTLTDRIYFADTGGQVWRVDLPGAVLPDRNQTTWRAVKLAAVNGGTAATDRRFFNAPDVVRTSYAGAAFDAILIGSGNRAHPNEMDDPNDPNDPAVDNQFYMFRDKAINPYFTAAPTPGDCNATPPSVDFRCQLPLDPNDLYDTTSNVIQTGTAAQKATAQAALAAKNGWRLDLQADPNLSGEKSLARAITVAGNVYFTTFTPQPSDTRTCDPVPGIGRLYVVNLFDATANEKFNSNTNTKRFWEIGPILPDTPSPHFGSDGEIRLLLPPGSGGSGGISSPFLTGASIPGPYGSYWYREDY